MYHHKIDGMPVNPALLRLNNLQQMPKENPLDRKIQKAQRDNFIELAKSVGDGKQVRVKRVYHVLKNKERPPPPVIQPPPVVQAPPMVPVSPRYRTVPAIPSHHQHHVECEECSRQSFYEYSPPSPPSPKKYLPPIQYVSPKPVYSSPAPQYTTVVSTPVAIPPPVTETRPIPINRGSPSIDTPSSYNSESIVSFNDSYVKVFIEHYS